MKEKEEGITMELIISLALILGLLYVASPKKPVKVPVRVEEKHRP